MLSKMSKENSIKPFRLSKTSSASTRRSLPFEARRILKRVQNFASNEHLLDGKTPLLIAVSGGPDSVCLLDILVFLKSKNPSFALAIAHVNYRLRGEESENDELFVRELAKRYRVPCFVKRYPKNSRKSDEKSLRDFRYTFFSSLSEQHGFENVALGHQKNDQAETFLLNLIRGAGPLGLAGMSPKQGRYIRPLLNTSREDILAYLSACGLSFRSDKSNTETRYTRNRIRKELIPLLEARFNPNIVNTLARSATLFGDTTNKETGAPEECPVTYHGDTASFSRTDFQTLLSLSQKTLLRNISRTLSAKQHTPTQTTLDEFKKLITAKKTPSASLTAGPLKCERNHDTVFLLYSLP
jgi:tRNA(Ile)-lysidine synthetase-like protein